MPRLAGYSRATQVTAALAAFALAAFLLSPAGWKAPASASEPQVDSIAWSPSKESGTPEPIAGDRPVDVVVLSAEAECAVEGNVVGLLHVEGSTPPLTIIDVLLMQDGSVSPVALDPMLPVAISDQKVRWFWPSEVPSRGSHTALLVQIAEMKGEAEANALAGHGEGWHLADIASAGTACATTTPAATASATEITATITPATPDQFSTPTPDVSAPAAGESSPERPESSPTALAEDHVVENESGPTPVSFTVAPEAGLVDEAPAAATPVPATSTALAPEIIEIKGRTSDSRIAASETARYRFRVTNTLDRPVVAVIRTSDSATGWTSAFAGEHVASTHEVRLDAGESAYLIVIVYAPSEAAPGSKNVTTVGVMKVQEST